MDNIVNDVKNLFRRAKIFFRASANKILSPKTKIDDDKNILQQIFNKYNSINYKKILKHEEIFYGKRNYFKVLKKFLTYIIQIEDLFLSLNGKKITIIQELSGFSSSLSLYYVSKKFRYNNYFIEPSFFDGRFHMTLNTLMCDPVANNRISKHTNILQIVNKIKNLKKIIIPKKDVSHFLNPFNKIFNYETTIGVAKHYYGYTHALGGIVVMKGSDFERINGYPCFLIFNMILMRFLDIH